MKKLSGTGMFLFIILFTSAGFGQSEEANYLRFDYVKVAPGQVQAYVEYMNSMWKPLYQQQVEEGKIDSWSLYRVFTPGGDGGKYNFVAITSAAGLNVFESLSPRDILMMDQRSRDQINNMMAKANELRTVMYTEFWKAINKIAEDAASPHSAKYMMVDYMLVAPGKDYDYQMLEDEVAKPIHQERKATDRMVGWELYSLITPGGQNYGYNFATGNFFDELEDVEYGFTEDVIKNALPGTDIPELFDTIFDTRRLVNSQIWELVYRVD
ncbi:hypothetical protein [Halalkalibaculum sp. DA384]|uniref:hypothetical protein n=1 Tax=Halalkalibaculum sp. DA384 TaxID=3373606 RepID=UPI0037553750